MTKNGMARKGNDCVDVMNFCISRYGREVVSMKVKNVSVAVMRA